MFIKMKIGGSFRGAVSKHAFRFYLGEVLEIDQKDIPHIPESDYEIVEKGTPSGPDPEKVLEEQRRALTRPAKARGSR